MMIGSSVDYVRSGGMRNVPATKAVENLYETIAKFLLVSRPAYSYPPRRACKKKSIKSGMSTDEDTPVGATLTDLEICQAVCEQYQAIKVDDSDGDECVAENLPTNAEMRQALDILKRGLQRRSTNFKKQYECEQYINEL
ncbi:hypothetical protein AVEN_115393-1 [Araneus ventricosus]|uniref:Uncharacterized protein n=1 Tax=Araneus ventricosus TaxID=182803 RepID=A0A4Y1ZYC5_ARAVE|nr:hypothetical protein AVEN_115393-1 [Araneus ventricosus]